MSSNPFVRNWLPGILPTVLLCIAILGGAQSGCATVPCPPEKPNTAAAPVTATWYRFDAQLPKGGFCEQQVFGPSRWIAEPFNFIFSLSMIVLGLVGLFRSRNTTMAFQFLFCFLAAYGVFAAMYHATLQNGWYRMMDVAGSFIQSFILVMLIHSLYLYHIHRSIPSAAKRRYRHLTNLLTLVFTLYPAAVHVAGESSQSPWVAWLVFDLLWIVIATVLILIWRRRNSWPGVIAGGPAFGLVWYAIAACVIAYGAWSIDKFVCTCQTPLLAYLQLHGWWHVFMGLCFYLMITLARFLNAHEYHFQPNLQFVPQTGVFRLPVVEWLPQDNQTSK